VSSPTALLLVDVQQDFLARPDLVPPSHRLIASLRLLLDHARSDGWPVIHVQTRAAADRSNWMPHWLRRGTAECLENTPGADAPAELAPVEGETVLPKTHFSAFSNPALADLLGALGVARLIIAGVHTHACIRSTVTEAYAFGYEVSLPRETMGSYDPDHSARSLEWLEARAADVMPLAQVLARPLETPVWEHRNPSDWTQLLGVVAMASEDEVLTAVGDVGGRAAELAAIPIGDRGARLRAWRDHLVAERHRWTDLLIRDVGKPRGDAEGEVGYGLALLDRLCATLVDEESGDGREVRYRPLGTVGLITPWNNPFAIPISKIAPALGYGNCAVWKPALPATSLSRALHQSLDRAGLRSFVKLVEGDGQTGRWLAEAPGLAGLAFTGSVAVGRQLASLCGRLARPLQAELGGNNGAIVLKDADVDEVAVDLAAAMFSFAGQRCTAIRRIIVENAIYDRFKAAIARETQHLRLGMADELTTQIGPVISPAVRDHLLDLVAEAVTGGAKKLTGGGVSAPEFEKGCWMEPTLLSDLPATSPILEQELFGPVAAIIRADDLDHAIRIHNNVEQGLVGAIYTGDAAAQSRFLEQAQAGILSVNRARPAFSSAGPFVGWKASGYGVPEHGRWNRDFYTRVQVVYR